MRPAMPLPIACQLVPSQRAMFFTVMPLALLKVPPTYTFLPSTATASTAARSPKAPLTPSPTGHHRVPSQRAILVAVTPPASLKLPPTNTLVPSVARADTTPGMPEPRDDQFVPSHRVTFRAGWVPAFVNVPARVKPTLAVGEGDWTVHDGSSQTRAQRQPTLAVELSDVCGDNAIDADEGS